MLTPKEMLLLEVMAQDQAQALALAMRPLIKLQDKDLVVVADLQASYPLEVQASLAEVDLALVQDQDSLEHKDQALALQDLVVEVVMQMQEPLVMQQLEAAAQVLEQAQVLVTLSLDLVGQVPVVVAGPPTSHPKEDQGMLMAVDLAQELDQARHLTQLGLEHQGSHSLIVIIFDYS